MPPQKNVRLVLPGLEPGTFRVLSERDNHYTTELLNYEKDMKNINAQSRVISVELQFWFLPDQALDHVC